LRQLRKNQGYACAVIFTLALGIGATTAIFSAVNPILLAPLPYPDAGRITMIVELDKATGSHNSGTFVSHPMEALRAE